MPKNTYDDKDTPVIPSSVWQSFARVLHPLIVDYFETDEGRQAYADWQEKNGSDPDRKQKQRQEGVKTFLPILYPVFDFIPINNKSEPIPNRI